MLRCNIEEHVKRIVGRKRSSMKRFAKGVFNRNESVVVSLLCSNV